MKNSYLIVIPARDEEECLPDTLADLAAELPENCRVAVGLNGCQDDSRGVCERFGVLIGETKETGYGHGCRVAIDAGKEAGQNPNAYLFYVADGANSPNDLLRLIAFYENTSNDGFIIGLRRFRLKGWIQEFGRALPNLILGTLCHTLGGQFFHDLGPMRLIERRLLERMQLRELVWGWTIEAQIRAAQLGVKIEKILVEEYPRRHGQQKVSGVSFCHSARVGWEIARAAWRTRFAGNQNPRRQQE